ncbi:hypothetical protein [Microvirga makkahensis]|uniref:DUF2946 domain-containing protein n=1 Tax=Microvirga makkahensis TaxID=1128670 RepID=A0A7X3MU07_9HYPH|nr:hypothetical protein [Microvirga makkahensis]MXQ13227.1 hypothetical protein [Microvirga makkahensis]
MTPFIRRLLSRWLAALAAIGLLTAPLHAVTPVQASVSPKALHHISEATIDGGLGHADHGHGGPSKGRVLGQSCCHSACALALIPSYAGNIDFVSQPALVSTLPDVMPPPKAPPSIDRPPKRS